MRTPRRSPPRPESLGPWLLERRSLEAVLGDALDAAIAVCEADCGNIQIRDPRTGALRIAVARGLPRWWKAYWDRCAVSHGVCGKAIARGRRVIVPDVERSAIFIGSSAMPVMRRAGVRAVQSTPLIDRSGTLLGVLSTHWRRTRRPSAAALRRVDAISAQSAEILMHGMGTRPAEIVSRRRGAGSGLRAVPGVDSRELFKMLLEFASPAFAVFDRRMRYLAYNGVWLRDLRTRRKRILGLRHDRVLKTTPAQWKAWKAGYRRILAGAVEGREFDIFRRPGEQHWMRWVLRPWHEPSGRIGGLVAFRDNLTEQARAGEWFRTALEVSPIPQLLIDEEGAIAFANAQAERTFGYAFGQLDGRRLTTLIPHGLNLRASRRDGRILQGLRKDGGTVPVTAGLTRLPTRARALTMVTLADMSERLRAQEVEKLRSRAAAQESFLANFSHELRTPLGAVLNAAEVLRGDALKAPRTAARFLRVIHDNAAHLSTMVDDLLDLAALGARRTAPVRVPVPIGSLVEREARRFEGLAAAKGLRVRVRAARGLRALCDPREIGHVLGNLLDNAIRYNQRGGEVVVSVSRDPGGAGSVRVSVRDSGFGIPREELRSVFERFNRGRRSLRSGIKGTGLGLAIAKAIVEAQRGRIWAERAPGGGAVLSFTLPSTGRRS